MEKRILRLYKKTVSIVGETPLYFAERLSEKYGTKIYLKREDLNHTGAHKINNVIGQILLAKRICGSRSRTSSGKTWQSFDLEQIRRGRCARSTRRQYQCGSGCRTEMRGRGRRRNYLQSIVTVQYLHSFDAKIHLPRIVTFR